VDFQHSSDRSLNASNVTKRLLDRRILVLIDTGMEFPRWAGETAVKRGGSENPGFPPPAASLRKRLEAEIRPITFWQWDARSAVQIEERRMIEAAPRPKQTYEEIKPELAMTSSILVGCMTGRSAGFSPLRMRPT